MSFAITKEITFHINSVRIFFSFLLISFNIKIWLKKKKNYMRTVDVIVIIYYAVTFGFWEFWINNDKKEEHFLLLLLLLFNIKGEIFIYKKLYKINK